MAVNMATETVPSAESADSSSRPKPPPAPPKEIAQHFPNFDILECLGRGGMGVVYKARQKSLNRLVALKILAPEREKDAAFAQRFVAEAETLAKLNHPGIVTIFDFGQTSGLFYLVMEFVDGVTLRRLLEAGRVSPREALAIVPQICDALQYAHDQGVIHRDIKPENILIDRLGRVKVADFGLAKLIGAAEALAAPAGDVPAAPALTQAGQVMGTPSYMAPEQFDHPSAVDHRADIYALGVVFYQMLTGELPARRLEPPSKKVRIDVRLDDVVLRTLEQEPQRRYQQASQVKAAVETIVTEPGSPTPPPSPKPESKPEAPPSSPVYTNQEKKGELFGLGAAVQAVGLGLCFVPYCLVLGIVLLVIGGRMALKLVCGHCGQQTDKGAKTCAACGARFEPAPGGCGRPPAVAVGWKVLLWSLSAAFLVLCTRDALVSIATLKGFLIAVAISVALLLAILLVVLKARWPRGFFAPLLPVFLLVFGAGALGTAILNESYGSMARIKITPTRPDGTGAPGLTDVSRLYNPYLIQTELQVLQSEVILGKAVANLGWDRELTKRFRRFGDSRTVSSEDTLIMLRMGLSVQPVRNANIIEIQVFDQESVWAARLANEIAQVYKDRYSQSESPRQGLIAFQVEIVDHATPAWRPIRPNRPVNLLMATAAGLSLGWVAAVARAAIRAWKSRGS
jgi:capsular polysaccharide biosynthesis protein/tRNA A-37 threonylcarbamoyl transferase component Bud32